MKITAIIANNINYYKNSISNVNFKATLQDDGCAIDGNPEGDKTRTFLRERLLANATIPYGGYDEYACDATNASNITEVYLQNFRDLGNSSYAGENIMHRPLYFKLLKPSGVTRIIDLINKPGLKEKCEEFGLEYYLYDANHGYCGHDIFFNDTIMVHLEKQELAKKGLTKKDYTSEVDKCKAKIQQEKINTIKKIKDFIDTINQGGFYISCEYGEYRTTNCLALATTLNPLWEGERIEPTSSYAPKLYLLYQKLTSEHKKILGIDKTFDKYLKEYLDQILHKVYLANH